VASAPTLGERVRALRHEAGWTLAVLAERAQISVSYLNDIEHDRTLPSLERLQRIAEALGETSSSLLERVDRFGKG
jgi:transcriptional regulator with XRE-family HTH domain